MKKYLDRFSSVGVVENSKNIDQSTLSGFMRKISSLTSKGDWSKKKLFLPRGSA